MLPEVADSVPKLLGKPWRSTGGAAASFGLASLGLKPQDRENRSSTMMLLLLLLLLVLRRLRLLLLVLRRLRLLLLRLLLPPPLCLIS